MNKADNMLLLKQRKLCKLQRLHQSDWGCGGGEGRVRDERAVDFFAEWRIFLISIYILLVALFSNHEIIR